MRQLSLTTFLFLALPILALIGCGPKDEHPHVAGNDDKATTQAGASKAESAKASTAASIDWCIVSGEELGSMGDPVNYKYDGREIQFCCKSCVKQFEADPAHYIAKLDSALAGQIKAPAEHKGHSH